MVKSTAHARPKSTKVAAGNSARMSPQKPPGDKAPLRKSSISTQKNMKAADADTSAKPARNATTARDKSRNGKNTGKLVVAPAEREKLLKARTSALKRDDGDQPGTTAASKARPQAGSRLAAPGKVRAAVTVALSHSPPSQRKPAKVDSKNGISFAVASKTTSIARDEKVAASERISRSSESLLQAKAMHQRNGKPSPAASAPLLKTSKLMGKTPLSQPSTAELPQDYRPSDKEAFMNERQRMYFRVKLQLLKDDIIKQNRETLQTLHEDNGQHSDLADRATSETDRALELRTRDRQRKLVNKIDAAMARIDDGSYGYCEETGEPISLRRLDARPIATLSLEAQERHERREKVYRDD